MLTEKVATAPLRQYPLIHNIAGRCAFDENYPWWVAFGYAANVAGTTDAKAIFEAAQTWLQGWVYQFKKTNTGVGVPEIVTTIIETKL